MPRLSAPLLATAAVICLVCIAGLVRWLGWPSATEPKSDPAYTVGQTLTPSPAAPAAGTAYREIDWQALLPKGWDPMAPFKGLPLQEMEDGDPRAQAALEKARQFWRDAPIETASPSNQVVHVRAAKPLEGLRTMDTVWISGVMRVERAETMMGDAGYAMHDARLEPYQPAQPAR